MFNYWEESPFDVISIFKDQILNGVLEITKDNKIRPQKMMIAPTSPWLFVNGADDRVCSLYMDVCFEKYGFIHSRCHECWKVCVKPQTLEHLMQMREIQKELGHKGKCGIDSRSHTPDNYGAFFYTDSLEEGRERYEQVLTAVNDGIGDIPVLLKRACTEFEQKFGDSRKWNLGQIQIDIDGGATATLMQDHFEAFLDDTFDLPVDLGDQPEMVRRNIKRLWIKRAFEIGDETYLKYTSGVPLKPELVKYETNR